MPSKMIYLNDEMYEKTKKEENLSSLIQRLLAEHYKVKEPFENPVLFIKKKQEELSGMEVLIETKRQEIEQAKKKEKEINKTDEEKDSLKKRQDEATDKLRNAILGEVNK